jgi:hypothetical protein
MEKFIKLRNGNQIAIDTITALRIRESKRYYNQNVKDAVLVDCGGSFEVIEFDSLEEAQAYLKELSDELNPIPKKRDHSVKHIWKVEYVQLFHLLGTELTPAVGSPQRDYIITDTDKVSEVETVLTHYIVANRERVTLKAILKAEYIGTAI